LAKARAGREGKGVWGKGIPAPPERNFSKVGVGIFAEIRSDFIFSLPLPQPSPARARHRNSLYYYITIWNITQWNIQYK